MVNEQVFQWREDTPGAAERVHLNNAGASLMPKSVLGAITSHLQREFLLGGYEAEAEVAEPMRNVYAAVAGLLGATPANVAIVENATVAFYQALACFDFQPGDVIVTTRNDYISNQLAYLSLGRRRGVVVQRAADLPSGGADPDSVRDLLRNPRVRLLAATWIPTNSGLIQAVEAFGEAAAAAGVPYLIDACQAAGLLPIDVARLRCDFLAGTARKYLRGPRGIGFLYVADRVIDRGDYPLHIDMRGAAWITQDSFEPAADARRFENWEFPCALVLGLGEAARYATQVGVARGGARARELAAKVRVKLGELPGFRVLDRGADLGAIVTVQIPGWHAADVVKELRAHGINTSAAVREDAVIDMDQKQATSALRISPHYYNTEAEIEAVCEALRSLQRSMKSPNQAEGSRSQDNRAGVTQAETARAAFGPVLESAARNAMSYLNALPTRPVQAAGTVESLRAKLNKPLTNRGLPAEQVLSELVRDTADGLHGSASGRFFAWVIGGALPAALGADWLTSAWDQNAHCLATAPAAAIAEEVAGAWLKELLGIPGSASFALVTGCQMAHVTCLSAARQALLARRDWDVEARGLSGSPQIVVLATDQLHGSIERAVRLIGLGRSNLIALRTDSDGRLSSKTLSEALDAHAGAPIIVALCAGDLNIGAFDDFETLIPLAQGRGAWVHIDGAFGLWAAASARYRDLLAGAQRADSWATDGHKWLNVPYDCGYAFIADKMAHAKAMSYRAPYISYAADARDEADWNPEWSRRARGFSTYAAIRELGRDGVAAMIERCCDCAKAIVTRLGSLHGAQMLWEPQLNQGLVRFLDPRPAATPEDHDRRTDEVIARINAVGEAFFSGTTWRGRRAMRVSVCNWQTDHEDVERTVRSVAAILQS